ncbi:LOW QUALITY PROTEIN: shieldin complex subunit 2 [Menidia menidia]
MDQRLSQDPHRGQGLPQDPPRGQSTPQDLSKGQGRPHDPSTTRGPPQDPPRGPTRLLSCCGPVGARCSVLVVVVHPCHLKEVQVKAGRAAGTWVPLASIVVTDQSELELKVVLWRRAAFWVLTVTPGDLLQISGLQVAEDKWRGETVLQSTFCSKLLHLGHASTSAAGPGPLGALSAFVRGRRPLLAAVPPRPPQDPRRLPYACLSTLRGNMLVHALLRVTNAHLSPDTSGRSGVRRAVLTVEQLDQTGTLLLWGGGGELDPPVPAAQRLCVDFRFLLVGGGATSDPPQLHSTPWSSARPLDPDHPRARDHIRAEQRLRTWTRTRTGPPELDLDTLLSQKYSGEVQLRVQVLSFRFQTGSQPVLDGFSSLAGVLDGFSAPAGVLAVLDGFSSLAGVLAVLDGFSAPAGVLAVLDGFSSLAGVLAVLGGAVSFTGCSRCGAELHADANGVYRACRRCPPHPPARRIYRPRPQGPAQSGHSHNSGHAHKGAITGPAHKAPPSPGSLLQVAAGRLWSLLAPPRRTVSLTVRSHFLCDENSVPLAQDFTLLELKFPPELEP